MECNSTSAKNSGPSCVAGRSTNAVVWLPYLGVVFFLLIVSILCVSWLSYWRRVKKRHRMLLDYLQVDIDVRRRRVCGVMRTPVHMFVPEVTPVNSGNSRPFVPQHTENKSRTPLSHLGISPVHSVARQDILGSSRVTFANKARNHIMKQRRTRKIFQSERDENKHIFTIENNRVSMEESIPLDNSSIWIDTCNSLNKTNERSNSSSNQRRKCTATNYVNDRTDSPCAKPAHGQTRIQDGRRKWKNLNWKHEAHPRARDQVDVHLGGGQAKYGEGEIKEI